MNIEYWENRLGNTQYGIDDFFEWLQSNSATFNERIGSFELNKIFYRWLKSIADKGQLEMIKDLDLTKFIVKKEGSAKSSTIYFADAYLSSGGIEDFVTMFDPNASFITPGYIDEGDDIDSWYSFWSQLGIKFDIVDILYGTVIPNLSSIKNENLPRLLAENRPQLDALYPENLIKHLQDLKVKGASGDFYSIKDTVYIDCDLKEPFA